MRCQAGRFSVHLMTDIQIMRYKQILIGTLFCLLVQPDIHAQTLYTWTDTGGTIHITKKMPPAGTPIKNKHRYSTKTEIKPETDGLSSDQLKDPAVLAAARQAKQTRKYAMQARRVAEKAIQDANLAKQAAEDFIEPWRSKTRIRKNMQLQIESRINSTNQLIAEAETLIEIANRAEQNAQAAEKEASRVYAQFIEAYQGIITK